MALSIADATILPDPIIGPVTVIINGTLYCTVNGGLGVNGSATPAFTDALVQLRCRERTVVVASAITNSTGMFAINFRPSPLIFVGLIGGSCQLRVATPLVRCNSTLPSDRFLVSTGLRSRGTAFSGTSITVNIVPDGFTLSAQN
ncbi:unnamed protein product [Fraxinus pennsylvanica]|uniref:Phylloplanin n=1 Tax=Fraxinus pennsylvanica TaxID=56036 RepID=A0AAD2A1P3_9LAMI|nr:unnamed protein product [Fraxinus pennsylvanica]